ncbi:MAG TPA: hypothetical protein VE591_15885 [Candidatus Acidoferrum sp.]|nr:hypothetical protein [Candidatus Acidoferrum sp.]
MNTVHYTAQTERSPLQQAKTRERVATYSIALVVGLVVVLIASAVMVASTESATGQLRLLGTIVLIAQLIVSLATLALVYRQTSVSVTDIEQVEQMARRIAQLSDAVRELKDPVRNPAWPPAGTGAAGTPRGTSA